MKRYGNERPFFRECLMEARVVQCLTGEGAEAAGEMDFASVFQPVDEIERAGVAAQDGAGEIKGEAHVRAVLAIVGGIDAAFMALAAGGAEWVSQPWQGSGAFVAERSCT